MAPVIRWNTERAREMWVAGHGTRHIAKITGAGSETVIRCYAKAHGWPTRELIDKATRATVPASAIVGRYYFPALAKAEPSLFEDSDIERYREAKRARAMKDEAAIKDAKRLFLLLEEGMKPKRGRPRQDFRGEGKAA